MAWVSSCSVRLRRDIARLRRRRRSGRGWPGSGRARSSGRCRRCPPGCSPGTRPRRRRRDRGRPGPSRAASRCGRRGRWPGAGRRSGRRLRAGGASATPMTVCWLSSARSSRLEGLPVPLGGTAWRSAGGLPRTRAAGSGRGPTTSSQSDLPAKARTMLAGLYFEAKVGSRIWSTVSAVIESTVPMMLCPAGGSPKWSGLGGVVGDGHRVIQVHPDLLDDHLLLGLEVLLAEAGRRMSERTSNAFGRYSGRQVTW